jgi:hypothetical protein
MESNLTWQPYHEPLRVTLARTITIAAIAGAVLTRWWGGLSHWPDATLFALWFSFGGHWVELWFLNWLRPRLGAVRLVQAVSRVAVWFVGGIGLAFGVDLTAKIMPGFRQAWLPAWWLGGLAFIGIELVVHAVLQLSGRPNFYNGRG